MSVLHALPGLVGPIMCRWPEGFTPRSWQLACHERFSEMFADHVTSDRRSSFHYMVHAGVGSGKTTAAAMMAAHALNTGRVRRVVYVCPNEVIRDSVIREFRRFGIDLWRWSNRGRGGEKSQGEPVSRQGAIILYQSLANSAAQHASLCRHIPTMVIFDEIHHLARKNQTWGRAATDAFEDRAFAIVGLSGTPWRTDRFAVPFLHDELLPCGSYRLRTDYTYTLGDSIRDRLCRVPLFEWIDAKVRMDTPLGVREHDFSSPGDPFIASEFLREAVKPGSPVRLHALRTAVDVCRREGRKLIIFVGGNSSADPTPTKDAESILPAELRAIGVRPEEMLSVTSSNPGSGELLEAFGTSPAWILCTVNMVSEGVDIPQLSACLFLTTITSASTTIQRIGRGLRFGSHHEDCLLFMLKHPDYEEHVALPIEADLGHEYRIARERRDATISLATTGPRQAQQPTITVVEAIPGGVTFNGNSYTPAQAAAAEKVLASRGIAVSSTAIRFALALGHGASGGGS